MTTLEIQSARSKVINQTLCIDMMPRPAGKANKIAMKVIPGFNRNKSSTKMRQRKVRKFDKDDLEGKIVNINDHAGKKFNEKTVKRRPKR